MKKGFTLIELVIVIVILGILAAVAIPRFVDLTGQARIAATKGALGGLRSGISIWYASNVATGGATSVWPSGANLTDTADTNPVMAQGVPPNPHVTGTASTLVDVVAADPATDGTNTTAAWIYNSVNGKIWAANNLSY